MDWSRHFFAVNGAKVHYRRLGSGPAVLLLHGSPQSSAAVDGMAQAIAKVGLCALCPDTPGNGLSDALMGQPECTDYADVLLALADKLGLGRFAVYGFHTGAAIATAMAAKAQARITALIADGLPAWTEDERAILLSGYLPTFEPSFDGAHMAWLWARLEEQTIFFPWHVPSPANRMAYDVSPVAGLQRNAIDFLDAGDHYRAPYHAAFTFRAADFLPRISIPMFIASTQGDPLRIHLSRPSLAHLNSEIFPTYADLHAKAAAFLARHPGDIASQSPACPQDQNGLAHGIFGNGPLEIGWHGNVSGSGQPFIFIHDAGGSSSFASQALQKLAGHRPCLAVDLSGHGMACTQELPDDRAMETYAQPVNNLCKSFGIERPIAIGLGAGAQLAAMMRDNGHVDQAWAVGPEPLTEPNELVAAYPSLAPAWDGAHLLRAWRIARFERLFSPWFKRDQNHRIDDGDLTLEAIHDRAIDLIKAHDHALAFARAASISKAIPDRRLDRKDWLKSLG
jgi:pimeloyl-ACP methyl ester carboxylesterase